MNRIREKENEDFDVQERAGYYYAMLKDNLEVLIKSFEEMRYAESETIDLATKAAGLEFNSLSIIYNAAPDVFIKNLEVFKNQRSKEDGNKVDDDETTG